MRHDFVKKMIFLASTPPMINHWLSCKNQDKILKNLKILANFDKRKIEILAKFGCEKCQKFEFQGNLKGIRQAIRILAKFEFGNCQKFEF